MSYKGKFRPKNPHKYKGTTPIIYRSLWEYSVMKWLDTNKDVRSWGSETVVIYYYLTIDEKRHRYFIDFDFVYKDDQRYLVEIKPKKYTVPPKLKGKRVTKRYLGEAIEWERNKCKWKAAKTWAEKRGYKFQVWTEDSLREIGIQVVS